MDNVDACSLRCKTPEAAGGINEMIHPLRLPYFLRELMSYKCVDKTRLLEKEA